MELRGNVFDLERLGAGWPGGPGRLRQHPLSFLTVWLRVKAPSLPGNAALPHRRGLSVIR